jgi:hypothetical protein
MPRTVSGGLLSVLRRSRVAWYRGANGISAYYEQPSPGVPGAVFVNGRRVTQLIVDREGVYADFPCPQIQHMLIARGVDLQSGWTCGRETHGVHINEAVQQSRYAAVRHHEGRISMQCDGEHHAIIFVNGQKRWRIAKVHLPRALAELGLSPSDGWYPVHQDLIGLQ